LRVLAAAAAGGLRAARAVVERGAGVSRDGARLQPVRAGAGGGVARGAARAGDGTPGADFDAPGERLEIGPRASGDAEMREELQIAKCTLLNKLAISIQQFAT